MPRNANVLIVDHEEAVCDALALALQRKGYDAFLADSGEKALHAITREQIDVALVGMEMPDVDGLDLLRRLRAQDVHLMVIAVTSRPNEKGASALHNGAFDYVAKPIEDLAEVMRLVDRAVDRRRQSERDAKALERRRKAVVSTGNAEIDEKVGGGIPLGSLTLVEGDSHSGKSVLAQQMMWGSLHDSYRVAYFTTENTIKSLVTQMCSLNIDIRDFLFLRRLRIYPMEVAHSEAESLQALSQAIRNEGARNIDIVFVDAITPFVLSAPAMDVIGFFEGCKRFCSEGMTVIYVVHSHAVSGELLVRLTSLCDAHLSLRTEEAGSKLVKVMEVSKVRGANKNTGSIVSFEIEPGLGMRIIPLGKAQG